LSYCSASCVGLQLVLLRHQAATTKSHSGQSHPTMHTALLLQMQVHATALHSHRQ
jgi:hypothetical protein